MEGEFVAIIARGEKSAIKTTHRDACLKRVSYSFNCHFKSLLCLVLLLSHWALCPKRTLWLFTKDTPTENNDFKDQDESVRLLHLSVSWFFVVYLIRVLVTHHFCLGCFWWYHYFFRQSIQGGLLLFLLSPSSSSCSIIITDWDNLFTGIWQFLLPKWW